MLEIKNIGVSLGSFAMKNISLDVEQGDYLTVLGLSGAGKTVLLELLAGLVKPSQGQILFRGKNISQTSIQSRPFGLVYQDMALFPHMSVQKNIEYPMKSRKFSRGDMNKKVQHLAASMRIPHLLQRHPGTLSGGEAQRVALARVLAADPEILLLDEPLASLDIKLRQELRELLKEINKGGKTIIHVTHDHMEAATLSKKVAIIENGELLQWGLPEEVFRKPVSEFVARFSGIKNIFLCRFDDNAPANGLFDGVSEKGTAIKLLEPPRKNHMHVMIPGEDIIVSEHALETSAVNQFKGLIKDSYFTTHGVELIINAGEDFSVMVSQKSAENLGLIPGKQVWMSFKASAVKLL
jgi:molybdate/tungstate transport system ATP-binding protein